MTMLLGCQGVSKHFGSRVLFEGLSFSLEEGERVGLIGPNGSGKSTLLKVLAGLEAPDGGALSARKGLRIAILEQDTSWTPDQAALPAREWLLAEARKAGLDESEAEVRSAVELDKAGFQDPGQALGTLSGGWRKRLALVGRMLSRPDLLLLDEPTNHLDVFGVEWLEGLLKSAPFTWLAVSHDRRFLESAASRVLELNRQFPGGHFNAPGPYSSFLEKKEAFLASQARLEESLANRMRRELEWLRRGPKARGTKAAYRVEAAAQLDGELREVRSRNEAARGVDIDFSATGRRTRRLVSGEGVSKSLGGRVLFKGLDFLLGPGSKLGLLGANGSGKTSFLRMLAGSLQPDSGSLRTAEGLKTVLFDQHREQLDQDQSLRQALCPAGENVFYRERWMHVAAWAKQFLFRPDQLETPLRNLSGGEQARVLIARLMLKPADLLLLDEPTNDLDIPSLEVLEEGLESFPGCLVLVTHDRFLLDRVSNQLLCLDGGRAGFFADYDQWLSARPRAEKPRAAAAARGGEAPGRKGRLSYLEQREWEGMESKVLEAEGELARLEGLSQDAGIMASPERLRAWSRDLEAGRRAVEALYARWQELEGKKAG